MNRFNNNLNFSRALSGIAWFLLFACLNISGTALMAQELAGRDTVENLQESVQVNAEPEAQGMAFEDFPGTRHLAAALSERRLRTDTLLTMIAVERLLEYGASAGLADIEPLVARFRDERAWLDRLTRHYLDIPTRGPELDPAAWFVLLELEQHRLIPDPSVSPLGPEHGNLVRQLFDRNNERLSAAILPEVLQNMEIRSIELWRTLLDTILVNGSLYTVVSGLSADWFAPWVDVELPPEPEVPESAAEVIDHALDSLWALAGSVTLSGPTDPMLLERTRFDLLSALPGFDGVQFKDAEYLLVLAGAVDGLNDKRYLSFTESLLWVVSDLLLTRQQRSVSSVDAEFESMIKPPMGFDSNPVPEAVVESMGETIAGSIAEPAPEAIADIDPVELIEDEAPRSQIPRVLSDLLPRLSNTFSGEFSEVDPRINANLATVFDAVQYLQGGNPEQARLTALHKDISDAIAQLVLLVPEMNHYFDQPVRRRIAEEINICTSIVANTDQMGVAKLSREQFDGCMESLVDFSMSLISREELAGDPDGPFGADQLRRELMMPPWQRINFSLGYLHEQFPTGCEAPAEPLPNPLEWSTLATMISWFARQSPVYFQTPENEALVLQMRQQGLQMLETMAQQVDCISGEGSGINDPVVRSLADYRLALDELVAGIREAELEFRSARLQPGADVVLHGDSTQRTAYRTEELIISPCDPEKICEMSGELEATRALVGLFPDPYLIADQTGLGTIEICYENMQWVNRRAVPVRPDDPHVANYFGQLSFDLVGRYHEKDEVIEVFGSNFVSPDEYHYLFAAATDEVREDSCPVEWVGSKIVTSLSKRNGLRVVPDRLTYLAAARKRPSEVINANWDKGAEWRDWFVTGLGVTAFEYEPDEGIYDRVNQHLQALYQAEQSVLYSLLLRPQSRNGNGDDESLLDLQTELTATKALVRSYVSLYYPGFLVDSDEIRDSLEGYNALLDTASLRRFREANIAVSSINQTGLARLEEFQADWARQPEDVRRSGAIATGVAHALIRLNSLYRDFFVLPAAPPDIREPITTPAVPGG